MAKNRIKELRKSRGLTQEALAKELNAMFELHIERSMLSKWENNAQQPIYYTVECLAKFFGVSIDYLMGRSDDRVDEWLLDIVNEIDDDILENCGGNIQKAIIEQSVRNKQKQPPISGGKSELIDTIIRELAALPEDKQQEVLRYIRFVKNG